MRPAQFQLSKNILIKPYERSDEDRFMEMSVDQAVIQYMSGANGDEWEERQLFQKIFAIYDRTENVPFFYIWGIYQNEQLVGHVELKETEHTSEKELEIVYMLHPDARRKGIMKTVLLFFQNNQFFFDRQIIATVHTDNEASLKLLKKWGYARKTYYIEDSTKYIKIWLKKRVSTGLFGLPNYWSI
ncbi:MAG: GNAT family N-acetyltransferase [Bacteroidota bacterium]